jgi:hypothetical protein
MEEANPFLQRILLHIVLMMSIDSLAQHGNSWAQSALVETIMNFPCYSSLLQGVNGPLQNFLNEIVAPTIIEIIIMKLSYSQGAKRYANFLFSKVESVDSIYSGESSNDSDNFYTLFKSVLWSINCILFRKASGLQDVELNVFMKYKTRCSEANGSSGNIGVDYELISLQRSFQEITVGPSSNTNVVTSLLHDSLETRKKQSGPTPSLGISSLGISAAEPLSSTVSSSAAAAAAASSSSSSSSSAAAFLSPLAGATALLSSTTTSAPASTAAMTKRIKTDTEEGAINRRKFYDGTFVLVNTLAHHSKRARITEGWADFNYGKGRYVMRYKFVILKENGEPSTRTDNAWEHELVASSS